MKQFIQKKMILQARFRENMDGMWIAQIHGVMQFRLVPKHECREKCNVTKVILRKGQVCQFFLMRVHYTKLLYFFRLVLKYEKK